MILEPYAFIGLEEPFIFDTNFFTNGAVGAVEFEIDLVSEAHGVE